MSLAGLIGAYGSDSEDDGGGHDSQGAPRDAAGLVAGASSDEDVLAVNAQPERVVDGPSTNPEPPPEGLPLVPHRSMDAGADEDALAGALTARDLLPPDLRDPPPGQPHSDVQEGVERLHAIQQATGKSIMEELKRQRRWCNPDFLEKMVQYYGLDQYGSAFPAEVWDPSGLAAQDFWPAIEAEMEASRKRRESEASRRTAVAFTSGGTMGAGGGPPLPSGSSAPPAAAPKTIPDPGRVRQLQADLQARVNAMVGAQRAGAAASKRTKWDK